MLHIERPHKHSRLSVAWNHNSIPFKADEHKIILEKLEWSENNRRKIDLIFII